MAKPEDILLDDDVIVDDPAKKVELNEDGTPKVEVLKDDDGNEVDKDGNIISHTGSPEDEPIIDDAGNLIDKEGKVLKTKEEVQVELDAFDKAQKEADKGEGDEGGEGVVEFTYTDLIAKTGFTPVDEKGTPIEYDMTADGIASYINDASDHTADVKMGEVDSKILRKYPVLQDVVYHLEANNGNITGFDFNTNYSKIDVSKLTDDDKIGIVAKSFVAKGDSEADAMTMATLLKDANKLNTSFKTATTYLDTLNESKNKANRDAIANQHQNDLEIQKKYWDDINDVVLTKKAFKGIEIPTIIKIQVAEGKFEQKTNKDFYDYLTKPIKEQGGVKYSQWNLDKMSTQRTVEDDMYDAYLLFTKTSNQSFIKDAANSKESNDFRAKYIKMRKASNGSGKVDNKSKVTADQILLD